MCCRDKPFTVKPHEEGRYWITGHHYIREFRRLYGGGTEFPGIEGYFTDMLALPGMRVYPESCGLANYFPRSTKVCLDRDVRWVTPRFTFRMDPYLEKELRSTILYEKKCTCCNEKLCEKKEIKRSTYLIKCDRCDKICYGHCETVGLGYPDNLCLACGERELQEKEEKILRKYAWTELDLFEH